MHRATTSNCFEQKRIAASKKKVNFEENNVEKNYQGKSRRAKKLPYAACLLVTAAGSA